MTVFFMAISLLIVIGIFIKMTPVSPITQPKPLILSIVLFCFCCFLYSPFFQLWMWIGLIPLFYAALDDAHTSSFNILPIAWSFGYFMSNPDYWTAIPLSILCFLVIMWLYKKNIIGDGDGYALALFILILPITLLFAFLWVATLLTCCWMLFKRTNTSPFLPSLLLSYFIVGYSPYPLQIILIFSFVLPILWFADYLRLRMKKK